MTKKKRYSDLSTAAKLRRARAVLREVYDWTSCLAGVRYMSHSKTNLPELIPKILDVLEVKKKGSLDSKQPRLGMDRRQASVRTSHRALMRLADSE